MYDENWRKGDPSLTSFLLTLKNLQNFPGAEICAEGRKGDGGNLEW
jgi:hypothetical protein